ncbi:unnamed protein product [Rhizophagus irregularis]|nr:unnamed protein product [Rhizophagus irregularis]
MDIYCSSSYISLYLEIYCPNEFIIYKENGKRRFGRIRSIVSINDELRIKIQRICTYYELPNNFLFKILWNNKKEVGKAAKKRSELLKTDYIFTISTEYQAEQLIFLDETAK